MCHVGAGLQTRPYKRLPIMIVKTHQDAGMQRPYLTGFACTRTNA